jgi:hypothetical protein
MFDSIKNLIAGQFGSGTDSGQILAAATEHLDQLPHGELVDHVTVAITNLQQNNPELASQLQGLVQQVASNPGDFKDAVAQFISSNPSVLEQFAPDFAKGLLGRLGGG